jgi:hypothetical protein
MVMVERDWPLAREEAPLRFGQGGTASALARLIEQPRLAAVRSVNVVLTSTYWLVEQHEQSGSECAAHGQALLKQLAQHLTAQLGRGFPERNLEKLAAKDDALNYLAHYCMAYEISTFI